MYNIFVLRFCLDKRLIWHVAKISVIRDIRETVKSRSLGGLGMVSLNSGRATYRRKYDVSVEEGSKGNMKRDFFYRLGWEIQLHPRTPPYFPAYTNYTPFWGDRRLGTSQVQQYRLRWGWRYKCKDEDKNKEKDEDKDKNENIRIKMNIDEHIPMGI